MKDDNENKSVGSMLGQACTDLTVYTIIGLLCMIFLPVVAVFALLLVPVVAIFRAIWGLFKGD